MNPQLSVVEQAHGNLIGLRDDAFFDKLQNAYGMTPQNDAERLTLIKYADDLYAAEQAGVLPEQNRFAGIAKAAADDYGHIGANRDDQSLLRKAASDLLANPALNESAAIVFSSL